MSVVRQLKTGGCSVCNASEENVGLRRCNHILGEEIKVEKEQGMNLIDVSNTQEKNEEEIKSFVRRIATVLTKEEKEEFLSILRDE